MKRRDFLSLAASGGTAAAAVPLAGAKPARAQVSTSAPEPPSPTSLVDRLDGATIIIIDPRTTHL